MFGERGKRKRRIERGDVGLVCECGGEKKRKSNNEKTSRTEETGDGRKERENNTSGLVYCG
jgi:hypothetical protein